MGRLAGFLLVWLTCGAAWAATPPEDSERLGIFRDCKDCPQMVPLPGGFFQMGSAPLDPIQREGEGPQTPIRLPGFAMGRFPVTRGEYAVFVRETGRRGGGCDFYDGRGLVTAPDHDWRNPGFRQEDDHPVVCVTPADAEAYARWISARTGQDYRLPSEAEREYAARGGDSGRRPWIGESDTQCAHANGADRSLQAALANQAAAPCDDSFPFTSPAGHFPANRFGLHDMIGNIWEWTAGCWTPNLRRIPRDGTPVAGPEDCERVARGGSWGTVFDLLRPAARYRADFDHRNYNFGFRMVRSSPHITSSVGRDRRRDATDRQNIRLD